MKKTTMYFLIYYFLYCISTICIGVFLGNNIKLPNSPLENINSGLGNTKTILNNNILNFSLYFFFPIGSPLFQMRDNIFSSLQITWGIKYLGLNQTLDKLLPHGLLELPNMILYSGLSQYILYMFIITKSVKKTFKLIKKLLPLFICSLIILIIAAFIEGFIS